MIFSNGLIWTKISILQGVEEGVATIKAEVVDGVNKVQADVSESVTNGIEQVRVWPLCSKGIVCLGTSRHCSGDGGDGQQCEPLDRGGRHVDGRARPH